MGSLAGDMLSTEDKVPFAIERLVDDFHRQGGLDESDFLRVIDKLDLTAEQSVAVKEALERAGVEFTEAEEETDPLPGDGTNPDATDHTVRSDWYLRSFGSSERLSKDEVVQLARKMRQGEKAAITMAAGLSGSTLRDMVASGEAAKHRLVRANLPLVIWIARKYERSFGLDLAELCQEGSIGLMRAADKFDPRLGFRFSTYATHWIHQGIRRAIANQGRTIRLPVHVQEKLGKIRRVRRKLGLELGRHPSPSEIAEHLNSTPDRIQFLLDVARIGGQLVSLDKPVEGDADATLGDLLPASASTEPEQAATAAFLAEAIQVACGQHLPETRQRDILAYRFGLGGRRPLTLEELGQRFGVTRERIRQLEAKALGKLSAAPDLREYAELTDIESAQPAVPPKRKRRRRVQGNRSKIRALPAGTGKRRRKSLLRSTPARHPAGLTRTPPK